MLPLIPPDYLSTEWEELEWPKSHSSYIFGIHAACVEISGKASSKSWMPRLNGRRQGCIAAWL
jgi:hypothetical protein